MPNDQLPTLRGRWALITGASAGIGQQFAEDLAAAGCNLVLCARRLDRLEALAARLQAQHGISVQVLVLDLAQLDACAKLQAFLADVQLSIDVLINNAGFGLPGDFVSQEWDAHQGSLQVLLQLPTQLCRALLPDMQARKFGLVINVASLAGLVPPSAGHTTYGAIKSYLIRFSESLALEQQGTGVRVQALCPGFTYSEFHDANGARGLVSQMPKWL